MCRFLSNFSAILYSWTVLDHMIQSKKHSWSLIVLSKKLLWDGSTLYSWVAESTIKLNSFILNMVNLDDEYSRDCISLTFCWEIEKIAQIYYNPCLLICYVITVNNISTSLIIRLTIMDKVLVNDILTHGEIFKGMSDIVDSLSACHLSIIKP